MLIWWYALFKHNSTSVFISPTACPSNDHFSFHGLFSNAPQHLASPARTFILSPKLPDGMLFVDVLTVKRSFNYNYFYGPSTSWTSEFQAYTSLHHTLTLNDLALCSTSLNIIVHYSWYSKLQFECLYDVICCFFVILHQF